MMLKEQQRTLDPLCSEKRLCLALLALSVFYVLFTIWTAFHVTRWAVIGVDFRAFFASAWIATRFGFARVYDLEVQREVQQALMAPYTTGEVNVIPTPFLPVFICSFTLLLPLGMSGGFILWTLLNIGILAVYLFRLAGGRNRLLPTLAFLSFPLYLNLLLGQANTWLLICVGEFMRAWERDKGFHSGLWLGGLLLKPQTLILLLPVLFLKKKWNILAGFAVATLGAGVISLTLAGPEGLTAWGKLLTRYMGNLTATDPAAMANFRMLGGLLSLLFPSSWAWGVTGGLTVAVAALALWGTLRRQRAGYDSAFLLPLLAATCAVAWHSHLHMAAILIPPMLRQLTIGRFSRSLFVLWVFLPPIAYFLAITGIALLTVLKRPIPPLPGFTYPAIVLLGFHAYLTVRAALK